jgi:trans-aconitate methyltransferase
LPRGSSILDLCCGTGHLTASLCRRGYRVAALDSSAELIVFARKSAPSAHAILADARSFTLSAPVDAIVSTGDSLNHMTDSEELRAVHAARSLGVRGRLAVGRAFFRARKPPGAE